MRLKSVELFGFKSFADHTTITFDNGLTGILGPNGCGKSNVVDAIKWVLGEKSAKSLRGEEMLDVIFSGCATRPPAAMAEVKLIFDNTDQSIPLPYNEVCLGRRLHRSKESFYFINQNRCKLKDIRDLLLDGGIGTSAYSVIEQGRVEALLHAKPAERRAVFEEAAGIAKFKIKRKEILSRLDRAEQILLRVNDRVEEKEKQIRKVAAQASNARRHRRLSEELAAMRRHLYTRQYAAQHQQLAKLDLQRQELENELDREEKNLTQLNSEFTRLSEEEAAVSKDRDQVVESASKTQEELAQVQLEQSNARNRIETLSSEISRGNERKTELTARLDRLTQQEEELKRNLEEARGKAAGLEEAFASQTQSRQGLMEAMTAIESVVTALRGETIELHRKRQDLAAETARLEASEESTSQRLSELNEREAKMAAEEAALQAAFTEVESQYSAAATAFGQNADRLQTLRAKGRELTASAEQLLRDERALDSENSAKASRKATLEDLENSFAGAFEGVRNILSAARNNQFDGRGVVGMAVDLMTIPPDLSLAFETILGGQAQDVVVESARDAQSCIEYLKRNRQGRATFLPIDRIQPRRRLTQNFRHVPGVIGEAVDLVSYDRRYNGVMEYLLAGILVVDNLDLARDLAGREARGVKIVTLEGDVVSPSGAMTGGHGKQVRAGLVQRKAELDALTHDLADCARRLKEMQERRKSVLDEVNKLNAEAGELEIAQAEAGRSEAALKQNLAAKKADVERVARERQETLNEREHIGAGGKREQLANLRLTLANHETEMSRLETELAARSEEQRSTRERIDSLGHEFAALSGDRSAAIARVRELEGRSAEMLRDLAECREELSRPGLSHQEAEEWIAEWRGRLEQANQREAELLAVRDSRRATATELAERLADCRSRTEAVRSREREGQTQAQRLREGLAQVGRQDAECKVRIETIREKARVELHLEELPLPVEKADTGGQIMVGDDGGMAAPEAKAAEPEAPPPEWAVWPDGELQAKIEDVNQKLRNIGSVNPEAIDELAELEASAEFLRSHKEEQEEASASMRAAIDKLNVESSVRFQETFVSVRENFQRMFTRLYGGGKADLLLEEVTEPGADPLDAGIEIEAQPPGKKPTSISLLSGGEKALCAVALLFALFRSKPSPFCILDEVDAPLDESNINRFMDVVRDFTDETQFIIITHNQISMSKMDSIWGVTQPEQGISHVYGMRYEAMEDMSREKVSREKGVLTAREVGSTA